MTHHYCTLFDHNYLDRGLALWESMEIHCRPYQLQILALDEKTLQVLERLGLSHVTIVPLVDFETDDLKRARTGRTWQEYVWTITGRWMLWAMDAVRPEPINYMDADCYFFGSPEPVFAEIGSAPLAIAPHRFSPQYRDRIVNGIYNLAFVHAKQKGRPCIEEHDQHCIEWCYYRHEDGKFCDQKYLDDWPKRWGAHSIRHKGANLAPWNQANQYRYSVRDGHIYVDDDALVWYHFHEGPSTRYPLDPFVQANIYTVYWEALAKAAKLC